ncbi:Alpha amylase [Proteiniphilum saccharofermentans]|uniref:Alpha amylase n=1 Tax=Proteiniphilum saccharofermentans TaxID=1642647 RepID=A0A1R3SYS2_9BACT|nr:alpha-amylase family protein [Proteiniphilum saccharofermentans]SCD20651.1 Alpha amylase [Proteiniphilum saccharofermentans]SEA21503.1 Glycosidase [Porphyromonadaceae bacterium KH3R12]SFS50040.1 Glycosidase [Porphyromonadaceae bacterium NLAE-zl-C104]
MNQKLFVYQLLPRLFGNSSSTNKFNGTIEENGTGKFDDISDTVLQKIKANGYTHIWYIGVLAHASTTDYTAYGLPHEYPEIIKGKAGSPYAVRDYYDVDPDLAASIPERMAEFEALVRRTHAAGLKVIIDNVPNHVARNYRSINKPEGVKDFGEDDDTSMAFSPQNNFYYIPGQALEIQLSLQKSSGPAYNEIPAKATGNDCFSHRPTHFDWYETVKLNYGVDYLHGKQAHFDPIPDTWIKMGDILLYWAEKNIDGFRCDMAEMVPLAFWRWAIPRVKDKFPEVIFLAEIYNPSAYRDFLAHNVFDYLYDKVGLYDVLRDVSCGYRPSSDITFALNSVGDIQHRMLNFMENHDEQRLASDYFLKEGSKGKAAMIVSCCVNSNPVMVYAGQELGERGMDEEGFSGKDGRTTIFDYWSVDTLRRWNNNGRWDDAQLTGEEKELQQFYRRLIILCNEEAALANGLFYDLMPANYENREFDSANLFAFLRSNKKELLLVAVNFDNRIHECTVDIPHHAFTFFEIATTGKGTLKPLLHAEGKELAFSPDSPPHISLDPYSGEIYKISFS